MNLSQKIAYIHALPNKPIIRSLGRGNEIQPLLDAYDRSENEGDDALRAWISVNCDLVVLSADWFDFQMDLLHLGLIEPYASASKPRADAPRGLWELD